MFQVREKKKEFFIYFIVIACLWLLQVSSGIFSWQSPAYSIQARSVTHSLAKWPIMFKKYNKWNNMCSAEHTVTITEYLPTYVLDSFLSIIITTTSAIMFQIRLSSFFFFWIVILPLFYFVWLIPSFFLEIFFFFFLLMRFSCHDCLARGPSGKDNLLYKRPIEKEKTAGIGKKAWQEP